MMMRHVERIVKHRFTVPSPWEVVRLGTIAGVAYLIEMVVDMRATGNRYDDLVLWGGLFSRSPGKQRLLGLAGHFSLSAGLAGAYLAAQPMLPRWPGWARGLAFVMVEHLLSFPTVMLGDRRHPSVQRGELPSLATRSYFWVETVRHIAYGLALGLAGGERTQGSRR